MRGHAKVPVSVDFNRCRWLPDDWGQGVKATLPNSRSKPNGGGGNLAEKPSEKRLRRHRRECAVSSCHGCNIECNIGYKASLGSSQAF